MDLIFTSKIPYILENQGSFENKGGSTKTSVTLSRFWPLRWCVPVEGEGDGLLNLLKKENS